MGCSRLHCLICLSLCGGIFLVGTIVMVVLWPGIYLDILKKELVLTNTSTSYQMWKETPIPMYFELFLYNFTNAEEVMKNPKNVKPHFVEMGPYVFKEHHIKVNQTWHSNSTITFQQRRIWNFEPEMTNGSLSDKVTNINVVAATIGHFFRDYPEAFNEVINTFIQVEKEHLIVTRTAGELLFDGYEDRLIRIANRLNLSIPYDKFGWFYNRNMSDTYDGVSNMFTGANDISKLGDLDMWNYERSVPFYDGECGKVKGGTGELFAPFFDQDNITIFATDVCSAITLKRTGDTVFEGITGSLFVGDDTVFDNGTKYEEQKCFCPAGSLCPPTGAREVSKCKLGAPAFVTFPHFYLADPYYTSKVDGLVPNKDNDEFRMGLEVYTGIPLFVRAQLQINILLEHIPGFSIFQKMPDKVYFPLLWFRQEISLTEEYANQAKLALSIQDIVTIVLYCLMGISILILLGSTFYLVKIPMSRTESQSVLLPSE